jgi:predicted dehydrogenase
MTTLRWGILGAARINQQLMPAIVAANNSQLVAIASRRPNAAAETLAQYAPDQSDVQIYDDPSALLAADDIDAVYIPMSNGEHAAWVLQALEQGKHVLCEKPLALTVTDIDAITALAKKNNLVVMEGFMYRHHPQHQRVKEVLDSGLIGDVRVVRSSFAFTMQTARMYRLALPLSEGGGAMWDIGCYAIHAARFPFFDRSALAVTAMATHLENGADTNSAGIIDYGDGCYAQFEFSFGHARRAEYEIIGTKGGLKCHNVWAKYDETPILSWWTESGEQHEESLPLSNHFVLEVEQFGRCVLNGDTPLLSLADARINCQLINATLDSVETSQRITL